MNKYLLIMIGGIIGLMINIPTRIEAYENRLIKTHIAEEFIRQGDDILWESCEEQRHDGTYVIGDKSGYRAAIARVFYERARLEMEMN